MDVFAVASALAFGLFLTFGLANLASRWLHLSPTLFVVLARSVVYLGCVAGITLSVIEVCAALEIVWHSTIWFPLAAIPVAIVIFHLDSYLLAPIFRKLLPNLEDAPRERIAVRRRH